MDLEHMLYFLDSVLYLPAERKVMLSLYYASIPEQQTNEQQQTAYCLANVTYIVPLW